MTHPTNQIVFVLADGKTIRTAYIRDLSSSYPYDGHWPLTEDEQIALRVQCWLLANKNRYYATGFLEMKIEGGAKIGGNETDFIVLLAACVKALTK